MSLLDEGVEYALDELDYIANNTKGLEGNSNDTNPFGDGDMDLYDSDSGTEVKKFVLDTSSCKQILFKEISASSTVRAWDILILIPNLCFFAFLLIRLKRSQEKLASTHAPILAALYALVTICSFVSVARCIITIIICLTTQLEIDENADKVLWLVLRTFLLAMEFSVMAFGILSGHLAESKASIKRIIISSILASLIFFVFQASLELQTMRPDSAAFHYQAPKRGRPMHLFSHGGVLFLMISSTAFAILYAITLALPILPCGRWVTVPNKKSFYHYILLLLLLNIVQAVGCAMIYSHNSPGKSTGMCFINLSSYLYFVAFTPVVYFTFLSQFLGSKSIQPTLLFSYNAQVNEVDCQDLGDSQQISSFQLSPPTLEATCESTLSSEQSTPIIISHQK